MLVVIFFDMCKFNILKYSKPYVGVGILVVLVPLLIQVQKD